jgi:capsule synthesis protein PGA_cap
MDTPVVAHGSRRIPALLILLLAIGSAGGIRVVVGQAPATPVPPRDPARELALKTPDGFTLATVGDLIELRPLSSRATPGFVDAVKILKDADVAFGNMETNIADIPNFSAPFRGFVAVKEVAADVKAIGIDLVNRANNHLPDGGIDGMLATDTLLDQAGLVHAGTGRSLAEARMPRYLETPKGRVGLVGMTSTFAAQMMAGDQEGISPARPGLNGLRVTQSLVVSPAQLSAIRGVRDSIYAPRETAGTPIPVPSDSPDRLQFFGASLKAGDKVGTYTYATNPRAQPLRARTGRRRAFVPGRPRIRCAAGRCGYAAAGVGVGRAVGARAAAEVVRAVGNDHCDRGQRRRHPSEACHDGQRRRGEVAAVHRSHHVGLSSAIHAVDRIGVGVRARCARRRERVAARSRPGREERSPRSAALSR